MAVVSMLFLITLCSMKTDSSAYSLKSETSNCLSLCRRCIKCSKMAALVQDNQRNWIPPKLWRQTQVPFGHLYRYEIELLHAYKGSLYVSRDPQRELDFTSKNSWKSSFLIFWAEKWLYLDCYKAHIAHLLTQDPYEHWSTLIIRVQGRMSTFDIIIFWKNGQ